jgi:hypothetical protein
MIPNGNHYWSVRVVINNGLIYLASRTEPRLSFDNNRKIIGVSADWLSDPFWGDTLGYINWRAVDAVTWRWTTEGAPKFPETTMEES